MILLIDRTLTADDLNDASLGTALEVLYEYGATELFARVRGRILTRLGIDTRFAHLDSTTFSLHGEYEAYDDDPDPRMTKIVPGYSKDNNPDLNQVVLQMICADPLPVRFRTMPVRYKPRNARGPICHRHERTGY